MKKLLLAVMLLSLNALGSDKRYIDLDYKIKCIMGYKWIQFYEQRGLGMDYYPEGHPVQMFQQSYGGNKYATYSMPIICDGGESK